MIQWRVHIDREGESGRAANRGHPAGLWRRGKRTLQRVSEPGAVSDRRVLLHFLRSLTLPARQVLSHQLLDHVRLLHARQALVEPLVAVGEALVVDAHEWSIVAFKSWMWTGFLTML